MFVDISDAIKFLEKNSKFKLLVEQLGPVSLNVRRLNYESLIKIIINQQLSNKVANVIFSRLKKMFSSSKIISPDCILKTNVEDLRKIGISYTKINFMKNLAIKVKNNTKIFYYWKKLNDQDAKNEIQKLNGFGPWSSNIILLFYMGRLDIFPEGDSTLKKGYQKIFNKKLDKDFSQVKWAKPYRSILAIYIWKWVDNGMIALKN
tara:strand:- start:1072 stop:1686 length:615 start_codon:yes stop_codon:yes gene_type:complete